LISITDGCGAGQTRRASAYYGTTQTLVVSRPWHCDPDLTSRYVLYVDPWLNPISIFEHVNSQHEALEAPSLTRTDTAQSKGFSSALRLSQAARLTSPHQEQERNIQDYVVLVESLSGSSTSYDERRRERRADFAQQHQARAPPAGPPDGMTSEYPTKRAAEVFLMARDSESPRDTWRPQEAAASGVGSLVLGAEEPSQTLPEHRHQEESEESEIQAGHRHSEASQAQAPREASEAEAPTTTYHGRTENTYQEALEFLEAASGAVQRDGLVVVDGLANSGSTFSTCHELAPERKQEKTYLV